MKIRIGSGDISLAYLAAATGGRMVLHRIEKAAFGGIATDSREADGETLFAALRGERVDGHDYMEKAALLGCCCFLCERVPKVLLESEYPFGAVVVEDTEQALGRLASVYAEGMTCHRVAITGSVGKTTTKEMIAAVLGEKHVVHKTVANYNSTIGMPMSLMTLSLAHTASVLEMGMSGLGEISYMSKVARPHIACVTNIGSSHLEALGSRENICRAKLEILDGLREDGVVILNGDEPLLSHIETDKKCVRVSVATRDTDYRAVNIRYGQNETRFDLQLRSGNLISDLRVPATGLPFVWGALFAAAVGWEMGMDPDAIRRGLAHFQNADMRQHISESGGITIIEDCYNAAPESMRAAADMLKILSEGRGGRRVALLGDMRELGENSRAMHYEVGRYFASQDLDCLVTAGALAEDIAEGALAGGMFSENILRFSDPEDKEAIADAVSRLLRKNDIFLVKASRAIGAEKILDLVREGIKK